MLTFSVPAVQRFDDIAVVLTFSVSTGLLTGIFYTPGA